MGAVNHTGAFSGVQLATCEWCEHPATYRVKARSRGYLRFACSNPNHLDRTWKLTCLDLGDLVRETTMNAHGFDVGGRARR